MNGSRYDVAIDMSRATKAGTARRARITSEGEAQRAVAARRVVVVVGGDQDRRLGPALERGPHPRDRLVVQRPGRLVEEQDTWVAEQRAREGELLEHPGRAAVAALGQDGADLQLLGERVDGAGRLRRVQPAHPGVEAQVGRAGEPQIEGALL